MPGRLAIAAGGPRTAKEIGAALRARRAADAVLADAPVYGPFIPPELLARRRADSMLLAKFGKKRPKKRRKKAGKRRGKKRASAAQLRARKAFAAAAKRRSKSGSKKRRSKTRAASRKTRASKKKAGSSVSKLAQVALRAARGLPTGALSRSASLAKKWQCAGPRRTGCGSTGRVVRRVR